MENQFADLVKRGCKCFLDETPTGFRVCIYPPGDPLRNAVISEYKPSAKEAYDSVLAKVMAIVGSK